jgi:hypothetical protein
MDALWSKLVPSTSGWYEPTEEEMSRAAEMDEPPPTPGPLLVTPPSTKIAFHALRVICAAVFADWQSVEHLMGAPEGAMALVRDLSPLLNLLKPEGTTSVAVLQKATRLVHLLCRTSFGRKSLLEQGLRATLVDAFNAPPPRDSKQVISCCQIVLAAVSDPDDTPLELIEGGVIDPLAPLLIDEGAFNVARRSLRSLLPGVRFSPPRVPRCFQSPPALPFNSTDAVSTPPTRFQLRRSSRTFPARARFFFSQSRIPRWVSIPTHAPRRLSTPLLTPLNSTLILMTSSLRMERP